MITNLLGKILFSRQQRWRREREARVLMAAILTGLVFASVIGLVIYWRNYSGRN